MNLNGHLNRSFNFRMATIAATFQFRVLHQFSINLIYQFIDLSCNKNAILIKII